MSRDGAAWMSPLDGAILEALAASGPSDVYRVYDAVRSDPRTDGVSVAAVCAGIERLVHYGLVVELGARTYHVTASGSSYLDGTLDVGALEPDRGVDPAPGPGGRRIIE